MIGIVNRKDLTDGDVCQQCGKDLRTVEEIHVVEGMHFCSEKCAVENQAEAVRSSAYELAQQWYNDCHEIVTPVDIGITYEEKWLTRSGDINVIFLSKYRDAAHDELISTEVIGFYFGDVSDEATEKFSGKLKAEY